MLYGNFQSLLGRVAFPCGALSPLVRGTLYLLGIVNPFLKIFFIPMEGNKYWLDSKQRPFIVAINVDPCLKITITTGGLIVSFAF